MLRVVECTVPHLGCEFRCSFNGTCVKPCLCERVETGLDLQIVLMYFALLIEGAGVLDE